LPKGRSPLAIHSGGHHRTDVKAGPKVLASCVHEFGSVTGKGV
jgi:hypothetical protein